MVRSLHFCCRGHGFDPWVGELRSCNPFSVTKKRKTVSLNGYKGLRPAYLV